MSENNSFTSHFIELRSRLIKSILLIFILFVISYIFAEEIYSFLVEPYANAVKNDLNSRRLIFTALHETFISYLKVAFFAAFFLGSPVLIIQIYELYILELDGRHNRTDCSIRLLKFFRLTEWLDCLLKV